MLHPHAKYPGHLLKANDKEKLDYFHQGFVLRHDQLDRIYRELLLEFQLRVDKSIINVVGPTGVGKTTLALEILKEFYTPTSAQKDPYIVPAIFVEAPRLSKSVFDWRDFYRRILNALWEPLSERRVMIDERDFPGCGRQYTNRNRTESELRRDVERRIKDYSVGTIVIDESQHILSGSASQSQTNMDVLKSLANVSGCRLVLLGTYESLFSLTWSAQLSRRTLTLHFSHYMADDEASYKAFRTSMLGLFAHIPHELDDGLVKYADQFYLGSCGCIGILKQWGDRAFKYCLKQKSPLLSYPHFEATRLGNIELRRIAEDIREGKIYFTEPENSEIEKLLGIKHNLKPPTETKKGTAKKPKPGVRKPQRDLLEENSCDAACELY